MATIKHTGSFSIVSHEPLTWLARCGQHADFVGPSYEAAEDAWRRHVYEETGIVTQCAGSKENRWQPEEEN